MGYTYKEIIHEAKEAGLFNEKKAYDILCDMSEGIEEMALTNKEEAWALKRRHYQMLFGPHYNEVFAIWQAAQMYHKDSKTGVEVRGQHWSPGAWLQRTKPFPNTTTGISTSQST